MDLAAGCTRRTAVVALAGCASFVRAQEPVRNAPYIPTPIPVVQRMIELGRVASKDVVYDLGCGDGRIVIAAAQRGARSVGIDLNPRRIAEANANAAAAGVASRVEFRVGDIFAANYADASVVMLYLLPELNLALRPQLWRQLEAGSRVISHMFDMGPDWPAEHSEQIGASTLYQWTVAAANKAAAR